VQRFCRGAGAGKVELSASSRFVILQTLSIDISDSLGPIVDLLNKIQPKTLWGFGGLDIY
jgi:hypothetical protein